MKMAEIFSLNLKQTSEKASVFEIELFVEGKSKLFVLDTGAVKSSICRDSQTENFQLVKIAVSTGASGKSIAADIVKVGEIKLGNYIFQNKNLSRSNVNLFGLDFLEAVVFQVDLKKKQLTFLNQQMQMLGKLRRLKTGHFIVPIKIQNISTEVLFDTGADITVINTKFINDNSNLFEWIRKENGADAHGHVIESEIYSCNKFQIGSLQLEKVEMATFDFSEHMIKKMEGVPIILGNNVIEKAKWTFDLKNEYWNVEK